MAYFKSIVRKDFAITAFILIVVIFGAVYFSSGKTAKAERYYLLGKAYETQGYYEEAISSYDKSLNIKPNSIVYNALGNLHAVLGDNIGAVNAFQNGIKADSNDIENYFDVSRVYIQLQDYGKAEENLLKVLEKGNPSASAYALLGTVYIETNRLDKAEEVFKKSLGLQQRASTYNDLGFVYEKIGKLDLALQNYEMALQLDDNFQLARSNLQRLRGGT